MCVCVGLLKLGGLLWPTVHLAQIMLFRVQEVFGGEDHGSMSVSMSVYFSLSLSLSLCSSLSQSPTSLRTSFFFSLQVLFPPSAQPLIFKAFQPKGPPPYPF